MGQKAVFIFTFVEFCFLGILFYYFSMEPKKIPYSERTIASGEVSDLLENKDLWYSSADEFFGLIKLKTSQGGFVVELPHFVIESEDLQRVFLCKYYDRVSIVFSAQGLAIEGAQPQLRVESECVISNFANWIKPIEVTRDKSVDQDGTKLQAQVFVSNNFFVNPSEWYLSEIRFYQSENIDREFKISSTELVNPHQYLLSW